MNFLETFLKQQQQQQQEEEEARRWFFVVVVFKWIKSRESAVLVVNKRLANEPTNQPTNHRR